MAKKASTGIPGGKGPLMWVVEKWVEPTGWSEIIELDSEAKALECVGQALKEQSTASWRVSRKETRYLHIAKVGGP